MNIILAIADSNKEYTERLAEALQQHDELIIHRYTSAQKLGDFSVCLRGRKQGGGGG